jgi:UDP-2,3-diacylglucosamine pyrophosphatase LpxH
MQKRTAEVVIISDVHLGTYGSHAAELLLYLRSIQPQLLILNGDFIDIWNFSKRYFPVAHLEVIQEILTMITNGTRVVYITGNHDEMLRRYSDTALGNIQVTDKLVMEINGSMCWIFHGDVFDATTKGSARLLAKLGGKGYDLLILMNRLINWTLRLLGQEKMSFSKKVKNSVKKAVSWIGDFEQTAADLAIDKKYDYVICGHIHQPQKRKIETAKGSVMYLNSGDWVENLTSLEYAKGEWNIYTYNEKEFDRVKSKKTIPALNVITEDVMLHIVSNK